MLRYLVAPDAAQPDPPNDLDLLDAVARRAGLEAILHRRLGAGAVPSGMARRWERALREVQAGNLLRIQAWSEIAAALDSRRIDALPLKGMDLLEIGVYEPGERPMKDIDLLVRPEQTRRAVEALEEAGYRSVARTPGQRALQRPPVTVELHDQLYPHPLPFPAPEPGVWQRARAAEGSGLQLSAEDRIAFLCLHYYLEEVRRARSLGLLRDLAVVVARGPAVDWQVLESLARRGRFAVYVGRRLRELDELLCGLSPLPDLPSVDRMMSSRAGPRRRWGFRLAEREARRRLLRDLEAHGEPGLAFYRLFWVGFSHLPRVLLDALKRDGGGPWARLVRLARRYLLDK